MSLLKEAYEGLGGLLGSASNTKPNQEEIDRLARLYAQKGGVMNTPDPTPQRESRHYYDQYTPSTFGATVDMVHGSHPIWNEFGDRTLKTFEKFGLKVDRKNLFPWDVQLSSSADRDIPYGKNFMADVRKNPHIESEPRDKYEREWLERNTGMNWDLNQRGLLRAWGKYNPNENHLAITRDGAEMSRDAISHQGNTLIPFSNVTGHEYGHYLDWNLGDGNFFLSDVVESMINRKPHAMTQENLMELWMRDPRTAHLDMEDQVNVSHHEGRNNPREILGKLYTTALMGEYKKNPQYPFLEDIQENIARALGVFMDDQWVDEGHSQQIKDQRRDVMGALANVFSQTRRQK